MKHMDKE